MKLGNDKNNSNTFNLQSCTHCKAFSNCVNCFSQSALSFFKNASNSPCNVELFPSFGRTTFQRVVTQLAKNPPIFQITLPTLDYEACTQHDPWSNHHGFVSRGQIGRTNWRFQRAIKSVLQDDMERSSFFAELCCRILDDSLHIAA